MRELERLGLALDAAARADDEARSAYRDGDIDGSRLRAAEDAHRAADAAYWWELMHGPDTGPGDLV